MVNNLDLHGQDSQEVNGKAVQPVLDKIPIRLILSSQFLHKGVYHVQDQDNREVIDQRVNDVHVEHHVRSDFAFAGLSRVRLL